MSDYPAILSAVRPGAVWTFNGPADDYSGLTWLDEGDAPSQATLDAAWPQVAYDREYASVEARRRARYQDETDGMFFAAQREDGDLTAWTAACDQIKADLPYPTAP